MPNIITSSIPPSLLTGQASRVSVYTYDSSSNLVEVPWDQARTLVIDAIRTNGNIVTPSAGVVHAYGDTPLAVTHNAASLSDLIQLFFP
jgi:hypothetical protein